jgi:CheY-specific phosphatase CheX
MSSEGSANSVIVAALQSGLQDALKIQASTVVKVDRLEGATFAIPGNVEVAAVLGLTSSRLTGSVSLLFPKATLLAILNRMLGESATELSAEMADAAAEILNIVFGVAKVKLNQGGHDFSPAIPNVIRGKEINLSAQPGTATIVLHCSIDSGEALYFQISLKKLAAGQAKAA